MVAGQVDVARRDHEAFVNEREDAAGQIGWKIGAEIERAVFFDFAGEIDARIFFVGGKLDIRVSFVVDADER